MNFHLDDSFPCIGGLIDALIDNEYKRIVVLFGTDRVGIILSITLVTRSTFPSPAMLYTFLLGFCFRRFTLRKVRNSQNIYHCKVYL